MRSCVGAEDPADSRDVPPICHCVCCAGTHDDQRRRLDVEALQRDRVDVSTSCQRVLLVTGAVGHRDVQRALDIDLSTRIEESGDTMVPLGTASNLFLLSQHTTAGDTHSESALL